jgi:hypothetical protein
MAQGSSYILNTDITNHKANIKETRKQNMLSVITVSFSNMMNHFCHENSVIKTVACEESPCSHPFILRSEFIKLPMRYITEQQDFTVKSYITQNTGGTFEPTFMTKILQVLCIKACQTVMNHGLSLTKGKIQYMCEK